MAFVIAAAEEIAKALIALTRAMERIAKALERRNEIELDKP